MNIENKLPSEHVLDAISALKEKAAKPEGDDKGVDLVAIVKKLSRNRSRAKRETKGQ
jgi:hypothetical protein